MGKSAKPSRQSSLIEKLTLTFYRRLLNKFTRMKTGQEFEAYRSHESIGTY